ncbi:LegC family aminotransferase [Yersinia enterocolitica]|nr:LegC family aminotransferase [Yersinia enterocolitica]NQS94646.1 LegC family aminotransferase [Yersinia enterocolitica]NQT44856.1 LegC family aminotransferase [Yersinia enterocolitica]NQT99345.1 LegC family aminotransferase [Yersinia enterocolitica]HDL6874749.1 LegC family aminotransferase [Yersinia enterocolitica]
MNSKVVQFIRDIYQTNEFIPLHAPTFTGNEKKYVADTIDSTYVSSVGKYVQLFENTIEEFTGSNKAVATVNGTSALHTALYMSDIKSGDMVITQALTFVATCNALYHMGVLPIFVDVSRVSLGLCPIALEAWLDKNAKVNALGECIDNDSGRKIKATIPMHTFGHPVELDELAIVCQKWGLIIIEDAAESLGSYYKGQHTGTFGKFGALSFNGNKIITTGGGGIVLCKSEEEGIHTKHITTTAKVPHPYEFYHDEAGFNYRMPNINAALGYAQMESLPLLISKKRALASQYKDFFKDSEYQFVTEPSYAKSNYWLNAIICPNVKNRDAFLIESNDKKVMTRPIWKLMHRLPMFSDAPRGDLSVSEWIEAHLVNLPSTPV